jgi:hypothetical protein
MGRSVAALAVDSRGVGQRDEKEGLPPGGEPLLWEEMVQRPGPGLEGRVSG